MHATHSSRDELALTPSFQSFAHLITAQCLTSSTYQQSRSQAYHSITPSSHLTTSRSMSNDMQEGCLYGITPFDDVTAPEGSPRLPLDILYLICNYLRDISPTDLDTWTQISQYCTQAVKTINQPRTLVLRSEGDWSDLFAPFLAPPSLSTDTTPKSQTCNLSQRRCLASMSKITHIEIYRIPPRKVLVAMETARDLAETLNPLVPLFNRLDHLMICGMNWSPVKEEEYVEIRLMLNVFSTLVSPIHVEFDFRGIMPPLYGQWRWRKGQCDDQMSGRVSRAESESEDSIEHQKGDSSQGERIPTGADVVREDDVPSPLRAEDGAMDAASRNRVDRDGKVQRRCPFCDEMRRREVWDHAYGLYHGWRAGWPRLRGVRWTGVWGDSSFAWEGGGLKNE